MLKGPYLNKEYIGFYLESANPAIQSKKIYEAINIGFNRKLMITYLRNNVGYHTNMRLIPKGLQGSNIGPSSFNVIKAKKLVHDYQLENKNKSSITVATDANYLDLCEYLHQELQKIGIDLNIKVTPSVTLRQAKSSSKIELFRASWIADNPDAENYLLLFNSKNFSPYGPNYTHFKNPLYYEL